VARVAAHNTVMTESWRYHNWQIWVVHDGWTVQESNIMICAYLLYFHGHLQCGLDTSTRHFAVRISPWRWVHICLSSFYLK
jgi:hypothetical protein